VSGHYLLALVCTRSAGTWHPHHTACVPLSAPVPPPPRPHPTPPPRSINWLDVCSWVSQRGVERAGGPAAAVQVAVAAPAEVVVWAQAGWVSVPELQQGPGPGPGVVQVVPGSDHVLGPGSARRALSVARAVPPVTRPGRPGDGAAPRAPCAVDGSASRAVCSLWTQARWCSACPTTPSPLDATFMRC
jgi:hypothetical protein